MTVAELRELVSAQPAEMLVLVSGYEAGFADIAADPNGLSAILDALPAKYHRPFRADLDDAQGDAGPESLTREERERFENPPDVGAVLPEVGSHSLQRMFSGDCVDGWTVVQNGRYR